MTEQRHNGRRIVWAPNSEPQMMFTGSTAKELLFGGAAGGGKCLTPDHDVLTRDGWKPIGSVRVGESVLSWSGGRNVWCDVSHVWTYQYSGNLRTHKRAVSFRATPNHCWIAKTDGSPWRWTIGDDLAEGMALPVAGIPVCETTSDYSCDILELIGWWLTVGVSSNHGRSTLRINADVRKRFIALIERLSVCATWDGDEATITWTPSELNISETHTKSSHRKLLSQKHRHRVLSGMLASQHFDVWNAKWKFTTRSVGTSDFVQALATSLGISTKTRALATVAGTTHYISASPTVDTVTLTEDLGWEIYDGPVHCITVPQTGTFYVRHRGVIHVTGNSDALIMLPFTYDVTGERLLVQHSDFKAVLFRRTYPQLRDSIIPKTEKYYSKLPDSIRPKYNGSDHTYTFPSGAKLLLRHIQYEKDVSGHDSVEYQLIMFDELTHFTETMYTFLMSRLRSSNHDLPLYMRSATNPGGIGHNWVKERWRPWLDRSREYVEKSGLLVPSGGILRFDDTGVMKRGGIWSRQFIRSLYTDNVALNHEQYTAALNQLDPVTRLQKRDGNWDVKPAAGLYYRREWMQYCLPFDVPSRVVRMRCWDLAATEVSDINKDPDWTRGTLWARAENGYWFVEDLVSIRGRPKAVRDLARSTAQRDLVKDPHTWQCLQVDPGQAGKDQADEYCRNVWPSMRVKISPVATADKIKRFEAPSSAAENRMIIMVNADWNKETHEELEAIGGERGHDDIADTWSLAFEELSQIDFPRLESQPITTIRMGGNSRF